MEDRTEREPFQTRSPHNPPGQTSLETLLAWYQAAGIRAFTAELVTGEPVDPEDLYTQLALGARLAQEVSCGRWVMVAKLLRASAIESWAQIGDALGITETEAADGFAAWLTQQSDLYRRTKLGLTGAEAAELVRLAERVVW